MFHCHFKTKIHVDLGGPSTLLIGPAITMHTRLVARPSACRHFATFHEIKPWLCCRFTMCWLCLVCSYMLLF